MTPPAWLLSEVPPVGSDPETPDPEPVCDEPEPARPFCVNQLDTSWVIPCASWSTPVNADPELWAGWAVIPPCGVGTEAELPEPDEPAPVPVRPLRASHFWISWLSCRAGCCAVWLISDESPLPFGFAWVPGCGAVGWLPCCRTGC